jgi:hypothetical protein
MIFKKLYCSRNLFRFFCAVSLSFIFSVSNFSFSSLKDQYHLSAFAQDSQEQGSSIQILHQGMTNKVNFAFEYRMQNNTSNLDHKRLNSYIASLLANYPNAYDYWEVVNLAVTQDILEAYPQIAEITLILEIMPRKTIPYYCVSTVTRWTNNLVKESWAFEVHDFSVQDEVLNAYVSYSYREGANYPDFLSVRAHLMDYLEVIQSDDFLIQEIEYMLAQHLLEIYSQDISNVVIKLDNAIFISNREHY